MKWMHQVVWRSAAIGVLLAALPLGAHHSTALYDLVHGTIIGGVVTEFAWENPHTYILIDVSGENNELEHWSVELESASVLRRLGWAKDTVKPGDRISVTGARAKDNGFRLRALWVQLPDARRMPGQPLPEN
jgi:hypothetical protein